MSGIKDFNFHIIKNIFAAAADTVKIPEIQVLPAAQRICRQIPYAQNKTAEFIFQRFQIRRMIDMKMAEQKVVTLLDIPDRERKNPGTVKIRVRQ